MQIYPIEPAHRRIVLSGDDVLPYKVLIDGSEYAAATMRLAEKLMRQHAHAGSKPPVRVMETPKRLRLVVNNGRTFDN